MTGPWPCAAVAGSARASTGRVPTGKSLRTGPRGPSASRPSAHVPGMTSAGRLGRKKIAKLPLQREKFRANLAPILAILVKLSAFTILPSGRISNEESVGGGARFGACGPVVGPRGSVRQEERLFSAAV